MTNDHLRFADDRPISLQEYDLPDRAGFRSGVADFMTLTRPG